MKTSPSKPRSGRSICNPARLASQVRKWCAERKREHSGSLGRAFRAAFRRRVSVSLRNNHPEDSEQALVSSKPPTVTNSHSSSTTSESTNGDLCRGCQAVMPNDSTLSNFASDRGNSQHAFLMPTPHFEKRTISSIKNTASSGCPLCKHMEAALQKHSRHNLACKDVAESTVVESFNYLVAGGLQGLAIGFRYIHEDDISEYIKLTFPISANPGSCRDHLGIDRKPPFGHLLLQDPMRLAPEPQKLLKKWIETCSGHCDKIKPPTTRPKRILDLRNFRKQNRITLMETASWQNETQETVAYAALSHCWGSSGKPPMKTTRNSLANMSEGIDFDELPPCYQDAVIVCCSLDIQYLWIDSLCIIQDDIIEWEEESQVVAQIYQEALITIIPSASESCNDSFLRRYLPRVETVEINFESSVTKPPMKGSFFIDEPNSPRCSDLSLFYQDTAESKWGNRGWTFGERLFSTRRIYFGKNAIHWSCGGFYSSEIQHGNDEAIEYNLGTLIEEKSLESRENIFSIWYEHILDYSTRDLTFETDRLPAISALAKVVFEITGDEFLAGIWKSDIQNGLLWCATEFRGPIALSTTSGYIAPSWSWLARAQNAEIKHFSSQEALIPEIQETEINIAGTNPFGRVQDGHITIYGLVHTLTRDQFLTSARQVWYNYYEVELGESFKAKCFLDEDLHQNSFQLPGVSTSNAQEFLLLPIRKGYCLEETTLGEDSKDSGAYGEEAPISGLVLIPSGRKSEIQYCRAGIFQSIGPTPQSFFENHGKHKTVEIV